MVAIFANNATGKLGGDVTTSSTTLILQTGNGALFPSPTAGDYFPITVVKADGTLEIMKCTARSVDILTVMRSQEGTTAKAFSIGDRVSLRVTAGSLTDFVANKQPLDATLTALAGVTVAADKLIYATDNDTFSTTTLSEFARTLLDDADASTMRSTIGAISSTDMTKTLSSYSTTSDINTAISNSVNNAFNGTTIQPQLELGQYIDFHTSSVLQDFDARIICGAGNNTNKGASLNYQANGHYFDTNITVGSATIQTDGNIYMPWAGNWFNNIIGGKIAAWDVPTATANNIEAGGVGSYVFAINTNQGSVYFGATYAGSNLKPTSAVAYQGSALSGTWRCMGANSGTGSGTLYLRIS